jgi:hypothetical protein
VSDGDCADDGYWCSGVEQCVAGGCQSSGDPCGGAPPYCNEDYDYCMECYSEYDCSYLYGGSDYEWACFDNTCQYNPCYPFIC